MQPSSTSQKPQKRVLLTGFPPFAGRQTNPTQQLVEAIWAEKVHWPATLDVVADILPCEYETIEPRFMGIVEQWQPDIVLAFGLRRSGALLQLEQFGFNLDDSEVQDNSGVVRQGVPIAAAGPERLESTLNVSLLLNRLIEGGFEAGLSESAGRFLCNHLLYFGLHHATSLDRPYQMAFVHVPPLANEHEFALLLRAVEQMLTALAD